MSILFATPPNLGSGMEGDPFSATLVSNNPTDEGLGYIQYETVGAGLPQGLTLVGNTISGVLPLIKGPNPEIIKFNIKVINTNPLLLPGPQNETVQTFEIQIQDNPAYSQIVNPSNYGTLPAFQYFEDTLQTNVLETAGHPRFRLTSGNLPPGLEIEPTGRIYGILPAGGGYVFEITVSFYANPNDESTIIKSSSKTFTIVVSEILDANPVWQSLPGFVMEISNGQTKTFELKAADSEGSAISFNIVSGSLPPTLSMDAFGVISGTLTTIFSQKYSFTVEISDGTNTRLRTFFILTNPESARQIIWEDVPGNLGEVAWFSNPFLQARALLVATTSHIDGRRLFIRYDVHAGNLPPGLSLCQATGHITGEVNYRGLPSPVLNQNEQTILFSFTISATTYDFTVFKTFQVTVVPFDTKFRNRGGTDFQAVSRLDPEALMEVLRLAGRAAQIVDPSDAPTVTQLQANRLQRRFIPSASPDSGVQLRYPMLFIASVPGNQNGLVDSFSDYLLTGDRNGLDDFKDELHLRLNLPNLRRSRLQSYEWDWCVLTDHRGKYVADMLYLPYEESFSDLYPVKEFSGNTQISRIDPSIGNGDRLGSIRYVQTQILENYGALDDTSRRVHEIYPQWMAKIVDLNLNTSIFETPTPHRMWLGQPLFFTDEDGNEDPTFGGICKRFNLSGTFYAIPLEKQPGREDLGPNRQRSTRFRVAASYEDALANRPVRFFREDRVLRRLLRTYFLGLPMLSVVKGEGPRQTAVLNNTVVEENGARVFPYRPNSKHDFYFSSFSVGPKPYGLGILPQVPNRGQDVSALFVIDNREVYPR
jgi:hypothetical protein